MTLTLTFKKDQRYERHVGVYGICRLRLRFQFSSRPLHLREEGNQQRAGRKSGIRYEKATKTLTEEQKQEFYEQHGVAEYYVNDLFPSIQWSAMFVAVFNFFEKTLNDTCTISGSISEANVHFRDFAGSGIQRAKAYLSKVQGVHEPFRTERSGVRAEITLGSKRSVTCLWRARSQK